MMGKEVVEVEEKKTDELVYVAKFGGSSLANADRLRCIYKIIDEAYLSKKDRPVIVLSAMGKTTNFLLNSGQKALDDGVVDISYVEDVTYKAIDELDL